MSDLYASMNLSPRKKRFTAREDDDLTLTPKRLRTAPPTPNSSPLKATDGQRELPANLARLYKIHTDLQNVLSHALATHAISPTSDTGHVLNVLNHLSLSTYTGFKTKLDICDLKRLCWLWEWDGEESSTLNPGSEQESSDPFLDNPISSPKDWTRGSMGLILSPTTHNSKTTGKRVPAYGIGIEVEIDLDKDMEAGIAAVARWTAAGGSRREAFRRKLERWADLHSDSLFIPNIPQADLPTLPTSPQPSIITRQFAASSPKGSAVLSFPSSLPFPPGTPTKSPMKRSSAARELDALALAKSPSKKPSVLPQTPSRHHRGELESIFLTPQTPGNGTLRAAGSTPAHQSGRIGTTPFQTPSTPRRDAVYERVLQRSQSVSPIKRKGGNDVFGGKMTRDQLQKTIQEENRRRRLMARLVDVAESVWMLFSSPAGSATTATPRKRRALPASEVALAVEKSLQLLHFSTADVNDSLSMLTKLCPFFLKKLQIASEEWYEMPTSNPTLEGESSPGAGVAAPPSPGPSRGMHESVEEVMTRSPRRVKREAGGLRGVREIIRRELELMD